MRWGWGVVIFFLAAGLPAGFAENPAPVSKHVPGVSKEAPPPSAFEVYLSRCNQKLESGTANFMMGWSAAVSEAADHDQRHRNEAAKKRILPLAAGLAAGLFYAALDSAGGFLNMVTSPVPQFTIPLPKNGVDVARVTCSQHP